MYLVNTGMDSNILIVDRLISVTEIGAVVHGIGGVPKWRLDRTG